MSDFRNNGESLYHVGVCSDKKLMSDILLKFMNYINVRENKRV